MSNTLGNYKTVYPKIATFADFSWNLEDNRALLCYLKAHNWLDGKTRAVEMQWTVYNTWTNQYYATDALIEIPGDSLFDPQMVLEEIPLDVT